MHDAEVQLNNKLAHQQGCAKMGREKAGCRSIDHRESAMKILNAIGWFFVGAGLMAFIAGVVYFLFDICRYLGVVQ